jgi:hypothetical protein
MARNTTDQELLTNPRSVTGSGFFLNVHNPVGILKERDMQNYGATYTVEDGVLVITSVFPVDADWDGYRFHGYCRPTVEEIRAAGY